jgi:glycosyltransferase involved in cell wall biosynthesis
MSVRQSIDLILEPVHAIVLTLNEEVHLARCLASIRDYCATITVIDSGSTDRTVAISRKFGADVLMNEWVNHSTQINFAIDQLAGRGGWRMRIDADEVLEASAGTPEDAIHAAGANVDGLLVQRRIVFMGRRMRYGGIEPSWQLRLWRNGRGRCEQRWMDEHIKVAGAVAKSSLVLTDDNLNSLTWWTDKHNGYASREAIEVLNRRFGVLTPEARNKTMSAQARARRYGKEKIYLRLPAGVRAIAYFLYRYLVRLGFLDGKAGLYFHLMQGLWYRTLVDAKVDEITRHAREYNISITEAIRDRTGINIDVDSKVASLQPQTAQRRASGP